MPVKYFNWKLAAVLVLGLVILVAGAYALRQWRKTGKSEHELVLGNKDYEAQRWEGAAEHLGRYLAMQRDDVDVLLKYAHAQQNIRPLKSNNVQQAIGAYRAALRLEKNNSEAALKLIGIYLATGSPGEAELIAGRQLKIKPDSAIRRMLALALAAQRKFAEAAAELKAIVREHPDQVLAYEALGQFVEQRPADFQGTALQWFDAAVRNNPSSALAYIVRAGFYRRDKKLSLALADLAQAESKDLSDPSVRLRLAKELVNCGALNRAEKQLREVQKATPTDQGLWQTWAQLALKSNSPQKMSTVAKEGLKELSSQPWDFMPVAAELLIRGGDIKDANGCIAELSKKNIAPPAVAFLQGLVAAQQGNLLEAVKHWRQSMEAGNTSARVRLTLALALARLGDTESALRELRTLVSEEPGSAEGHLALAKLLAECGEWAEAAEQATRAGELDPNNLEPAVLHLQAQMQLASASSGGAQRGQAQVWRDMQKQLAALERTSGASADVRLLQFQFALDQKKLNEAETLLNRLKKTHLSAEKIVMAEAELLTARNKIDEAILRLNQAVQEHPESAELVRYLATLLDRQGKRQSCEDVIKRALTRIREPVTRRNLVLLLAQFYTRWERPDSAYAILTEFAEKLPNDIPIKRWLLSCEQVTRDSERAQKLVDQIKSLEGPTGWQWRYEQARLWFASGNFKSRYAQVTSLLQENMLANPNDQASRLLLARTYERAGETQLALSTYREALRVSPDDVRVIIPTVAALYDAKEYEEAEQILKRASGQELYHPELQKLQLQSYLRRGELDSASGLLKNLLSNDPNNQAACLSLALLQMQQNKFDAAATLLARLKGRDPNSLPVTAAQIQLNIRQGKPDEALRLSDEMLKRLNNASAYILRARTHASLGQTDRAAEDLDRAASIEPNNVEVWVARSDFHRSVGQPDAAIADIQRALALASDNVRIQKRAISLLMTSRQPNKVREGKALLQKALKSHADDVELRLLHAQSLLAEGNGPAVDNAEQIVQKITQDQPESSQAWALMGEIAMKRGEPEKAMDAALRGLAHEPNNKQLLLLKASAEAVRSPVLAVSTLRALHESDPTDVDATLLLANTYIKAGEPKKAIELLRKQAAESDGPAQIRCKIALAVALYKNGNKARGQKDLDGLQEADPNNPAPLLACVQLLGDDQKWSALSRKVTDWYQNHPKDSRTVTAVAKDLSAVQDDQAKKTAEYLLQMVLKDDPNCLEAMNVLAVLLLQSPGRSGEAAELYRRILKLQPDNVIAVNNLAWILSEEQNKHLEALELAQKGLQVAPDYVDLIDTRGVVYYRLGEYEKAIQDFTKCLSLYLRATPASVATRFHLARALAKYGQKDKAIEQLNQALNLEQRIGGLSTADRADAQRLLKELQEGR
jgi:tetratricopeptide (TPR) repeat protein